MSRSRYGRKERRLQDQTCMDVNLSDYIFILTNTVFQSTNMLDIMTT